MMLKRTIPIIFLLLLVFIGQGQNLNISLIFRDGDRSFQAARYQDAIRFYSAVLDQDPNHMGANYQLGECYRMLLNYEEALHYYEWVASRDDAQQFPLAGFYYAEMLKHGGDYESALQAFDEFHDKLKRQGLHEDPGLRIFYNQAHIEKEGSLLALNDLSNPKPNHNMRVLSDDINTPYMDYAAFGFGNDGIILTSSRSEGRSSRIDQSLGEFTSNLYRYEYADGKWSEMRDSDRFSGTINQKKSGEGSGSFNEDETKFYYTNCDYEDAGEVCHIWVSYKLDGRWQEPKSLGPTINQPSFSSRHPDITPTGDTLFFASDRTGGLGGLDIYMSVNAGGENWSEPQNLGDQVNTPFNELSPYYDASQKALFFSSEGHRGYGGYDIFMAKGVNFFNPEVYNPGFPFNSNKDDMFMYVHNDKGFLSTNRDGGIGRFDIWEFEMETENEIITEISSSESIAGRNSLFSDDYDFDSDNREAINDIISAFLAAKVIDVELALSDELAEIYNNLSLDDKERIERIIYARIRQLNERGIQAMRIEDEFYYDDLASKDRGHMDDLVTRFIGESGIAKSVRLDQDDQTFYNSLGGDEKEKVDRLVATRVKQANAFEFTPVTYESLPDADKKQVDNIALKYIEDKAKLDNLTISPTQTYYLRQLSPEKKGQILTSIKEKLLHLTNDTRFELTENDKIFYENLSTENIDDLKNLANKMILADVENLELTPADKRIYRLYNQTQQKSLDKILAKIINNTLKADLYFAEANLTKEEREQLATMNPSEYDDFVIQISPRFNEKEDIDRMKRFMEVSASQYDADESVFMEMRDNLPAMQRPTLTAAQLTAPSGTPESISQASLGSESIPSGNSITNPGNANVVPGESMAFYSGLTEEQKSTVDRLVAMDFVNDSYENPQVRQRDDATYQSLSAQEKEYVRILSKALQNQPLSPAEQSEFNEALNYYQQNVQSNDKPSWDRLIARELMTEQNGQFTLSGNDIAYLESLNANDANNFERLSTFRASSQSIISSDFEGDLRNVTSGRIAGNTSGTNRLATSATLIPDLNTPSSQAASLVAAADLNFYNNLPSESKRTVDRLIAMDYVNDSYQSQQVKQQDDALFQRLSNEEKEYINSLTKTLQGKELTSSERIDVNKALSYYQQNVSASDQPSWDRLIARELMSEQAGKFNLPNSDIAFLESLNPEEKRSFENLSNYRSASQSIISGDFDDDMEELQLVVSGSSIAASIKGPSIDDQRFYQQLSPERKVSADLIMAMNNLNEVYRNTQVRSSDDAFMQSLSTNEKTHIQALATALKKSSLSASELSAVQRALTFYGNSSPEAKERIDRLVAREALVEQNGQFQLPPSVADIRTSLSAEEKLNLAALGQYRSASNATVIDAIEDEIVELGLSKQIVASSSAAPSSADIQFYSSLSPKQKKEADLIIAMEYLNVAYKDPSVKSSDAQYYQSLPSTATNHLKAMAAVMKKTSPGLSAQESSDLNAALSYYKSLNQATKSKWDRLVAKEALVEQNGVYKLPQGFNDIRSELSINERKSLANLTSFRSANNALISSVFETELSQATGSATGDRLASNNVRSEDYQSGRVETIQPIVEDEQRIELLSSIDLNYYNDLPRAQQQSIDRIIAQQYLTEAYKDPNVKTSDDQFFKEMTPAERTYIRLMALDLKADRELSAAEKSMVNEAFGFYSGLAPSLKSRWNRLVAREALEQDGNQFRLSGIDQDFKQRLPTSALTSIERIKDFRYSNQRILSENLVVDSKDVSQNKVNFGVARFNNTNFRYISVSGELIRNDDGKPLSNFPLLIIDQEGKTIAKSVTGSDGKFDFEDIPRGDYQVVAGQQVQTTSGPNSPFFVKGLKVDGSRESRFDYSKITNIYFDFDSYKLRKESIIALQEIARLSKDQNVYIELKSHTDNIGADAYNLELSAKRNDAALDKLRELGVRGNDIEWLAMGDKSPVAPNDTEFGRQFNRRIEILIKANRPINYEPADVYLVRPKGTLFSIAKNFKVDVETIKRINGLEGNSINAFQPLRIPNPNNLNPNLDMLVELNESVAISRNTYKVKSGDSIMSIASKFNIPEELIIEMNNLQSTELTPGQELRIYVRDN